MARVPTRTISPAYPRSRSCWRISLWNREAIRTTDGTLTSATAFGGITGTPCSELPCFARLLSRIPARAMSYRPSRLRISSVAAVWPNA